MEKSKISTSLSKKFSKKSSITSNFITFTFMMIRSLRISFGLKIFQGSSNRLQNLAVQAN